MHKYIYFQIIINNFFFLVCDRGSYGDDCSERCGHCRDVNKCSNINGKCLTGCGAGYQGDLCKTCKCFVSWYNFKFNYICVCLQQTGNAFWQPF